MNIMDIQARIDEAEKQVADFVAAEQMQDAYKAEGKLSQLREDMASAVKAMEAENAALKAAPVADEEPKSVFAQAFGSEADFRGIEPGMHGKAVMDAAWTANNPISTDTDLPRKAFAPMGFLGTLPKAVADGDEKYFVAGTATNAADEWTTGNKPESALAWNEVTAHLSTIAHWVPIHKLMAKRYGTLEERTADMIRNGLRQKADELAIKGNNSNGIVGIANTTGVQTYTIVSGDNIYDTIVKMAGKVRESGFAPNCVALHPAAITALSLLKDNNNYLFPNLMAGGTIAGLTVVEDSNLVTTANSTTTYQAIVYYNGGAVWKTADEIELTIGTTDKQFIQNAYTLLGETTALLRVDQPAAFCYCADMGL